MYSKPVLHVQIGVREQSLSADCDQSEEEIDKLVAAVNSRFQVPGGPVAVLWHKLPSITLDHRVPYVPLV